MSVNELLQDPHLTKLVRYFHRVEVCREKRIINADDKRVSEKVGDGCWSYEKKESLDDD